MPEQKTDEFTKPEGAALTGLRKKGHKIEKSKRDDETCYSIVESA